MEVDSPLELIYRDSKVAALFVEDRLTRQSSHSLLQTIVSQLEQLVPSPVTRGTLPAAVRVAPLQDVDECIVELSDHTLCLVNRRTNRVVHVFPPDFSVKSLLVVNHVLDRGPTNCCMMAFAQQQGLLWVPHWGPFHDMWNAVKSAAKKVDAGGWWLQIMRFASVANLNHGPFRSGAWGKSKQNTLKTTLDTRTEYSDDFREAARRTAALLGSTAESDLDFAFWWHKLGTLPSCHEAGPILKLARWMSIQECWDYYRSEIWLLRLVLCDISGQSAWDEVAKDSTAMIDAELARRMTTSSGGLLSKAPGYITQRLVDVMETFSFVSAPLRETYQHLASQVKTPAQGLSYTLQLAFGGWEEEVMHMLQTSLRDPVNLRKCGLLDVLPLRSDNASGLFQFFVRLVSERLTRLFPSFLSQPYSSVAMLSTNADFARSARLSALDDLRILLDCEKAALSDDVAEAAILSDIHWRQMPVVRLLLYTIRRESHLDALGPESKHLLEAIHTHLYDEKGPEDVHQHIRDRQRIRRHKHVSLSTIEDAQIQSGVLTADHCPVLPYLCSALHLKVGNV